MKNLNKILAVSMIAMLAVPAAHAKIVAESMLGETGHYGTGSGQTTVQAEIATKQAALSDAQLNAVNSGITSGKVSSYDSHVANGDIHVTAAQKTTWSGKQDDLTVMSVSDGRTGTAETESSINAKNLKEIVQGTSSAAGLGQGSVLGPNYAKSTATGTNLNVAKTDTVNAAIAKLEKKADDAADAAAAAASTASSHTHASQDVTAMTGYTKGSSAGAIETSDSLNTAIGKLEKGLDGKVPTSRTVNSKALSSNITLDGSDVNVKTGYAKKTGNVAAGDTIDTAIGKLETKADNAAAAAAASVQSVALAGGTNNGTVKLTVDGVATDNIAVTGLGSAAYTASTAYDAAGAANTAKSDIEGKLDDGASGYDIDAKTLKVQGASVLTATDISGKADKATNLTGATKTKITYNSQGIVTAGADLAVGDLPNNAVVSGNNVTVSRNANNASSNPNSYTVSVANAGSSTKGVVQLASGSANTTAENVSNKVPSTTSRSNEIVGSDTLYPTMKTTQGMITDVTTSMQNDLDQKQGMLGGGTNANKAIIATDTPGTVTYRAISGNAACSSTGTSLMNEGGVVKTIQALDGATITNDISGGNVVAEVTQTDGKITVTHGKAVNAVADLANQTGNVVTGVTLNSDGKTINVAKGIKALQKSDIATGSSNGTISVDGTAVAVKGLGDAAYKAVGSVADGNTGLVTGDAVHDAITAAAVPDATTEVKGKIEIATPAEAKTGTDAVRAITPDTLHKFVGTVSGTGNSLSQAGHYVLTADVDENGVATYYWEDVGR